VLLVEGTAREGDLDVEMLGIQNYEPERTLSIEKVTDHRRLLISEDIVGGALMSRSR
jgi:hypothetical protein